MVESSVSINTFQYRDLYNMAYVPDRIRLVFEIFMCISVAFFAFVEFGHVRRRGLVKYFSNRLLGFGTTVMLLVSIIVWLDTAIGSVKSDLKKITGARLDIVHGLGSNFKGIATTLLKLEDQIALFHNVYRPVLVATSLLLILRLFSFLDFHERLKVITDTVRCAADNVFHFFVIYGVLVLAYAYVGFVVLGSHVDEFVDYGSSVQSVLLISMQFLDMYNSIVQTSPSVGPVFFFLCYGSLTLLMFNVLLSIM